jgi:AraC-like DNA-binding protein
MYLCAHFMDSDITFIQEKAFKNYILGVLYILTGLYLSNIISFYSSKTMFMMKHFLLISLILNGLSIIIVYIVPFAYLRKLARPFVIIMLLLFFPLASWLLSWGITTALLWHIAIPLFIYAVFPDMKIIRWLLWYGCLILLTSGLGFALRYFLYNNISITFSSSELTGIVWSGVLNVFIAFLFIAHSLYYINYSYKLKISSLERLINLKNNEKTQNLLAINYDEQYKFGKIYEKIIDYIENTQPYFNSDFKIGKISNDLNINTLYIEKAITSQKNMNFSNFINSYRIAYAKKLIKEDLQYTLEYIYLSSGFKNQSSFNRAFKVLEGITPSEYRKQFMESAAQK